MLRTAQITKLKPLLPLTNTIALTQKATYIVPTKKRHVVPIYSPLATSHGAKSKQLMNEIKQDLFQRYDPKGSKQKLLWGDDPLRAGDIVRVVFKDQLKNPSFTGYLLAIDRNGPDSSILLRTKVTQIGVEQRFSIFNPFIERVDRVRKPQEYSGRNRHYYIRGTRRDAGDYESLSKRNK